MNTRLQNLPIEILQEISSHLSPADFIMLSCASQKLRIALGQNSLSTWFKLIRVEPAEDIPIGRNRSSGRFHLPPWEYFNHSYPLPPTWPSPREPPSEYMVIFDPAVDYRRVVLNYLWGYGDCTVVPYRCRFCLSTTHEDQPLQNCQLRTNTNSEDQDEAENEFSLPRYMTVYRKCEETKMIEISKEYKQLPMWNTDISSIPVWRTFTTTSKTGNITLRSILAKVVENCHGKPYADVVSRLEDRFTEWCNNLDELLIPEIVQVFSTSDRWNWHRKFIEPDDLKAYLASEWGNLWECFFKTLSTDKKTIDQIRSLGPLPTIGCDEQEWLQAMYRQWDNEEREQQWILKFVTEAVERLMNFHTFFDSACTLRRFKNEEYKIGTRGKSLPPFIPGLWRVCARRCKSEEATFVGGCTACPEHASPMRRRRYYSQFQYALHLYSAHPHLLIKCDDDDTPLLWKHTVDPAEHAVERSQLSIWTSQHKPRVSFRNFYCRRDDETGELFICDDEAFAEPREQYILDISDISIERPLTPSAVSKMFDLSPLGYQLQ